MKIGLISDTHGIVPVWMKALRIFEGADVIIHAGDVLYHPPRIACTSEYDIPRFAELINSCPIPIIIARGNCDADVYEELLDIPVLSPHAFLQWNGLRILVRHGHDLNEKQMQLMIAKYHADILVTGHTHIPIIEHIHSAIHVNPGSPSHTRMEQEGLPIRTVGLIMKSKISVINLDTGLELLKVCTNFHP